MNKIDEKMSELRYWYVGNTPRVHSSEKEVVDLETWLQQPLPQVYRNFIVKYGNIALERNGLFYIPNNPPFGNGAVEIFFGTGQKYNILETMQVYIDRLPMFFMPFARDAFGNLLCLEFDLTGGGKVYFWDHTKEVMLKEGELPSRDNIWFVANSFEEFILSLRPEDDSY